MLLFTNLNKCHSPHSRVCHFCQLFQCLWAKYSLLGLRQQNSKKKEIFIHAFFALSKCHSFISKLVRDEQGKKKYPGLVGWLEKLALQYLFSFFFSLSIDFFDGLVLVFSNHNLIFFMIVAIVVDHQKELNILLWQLIRTNSTTKCIKEFFATLQILSLAFTSFYSLIWIVLLGSSFAITLIMSLLNYLKRYFKTLVVMIYGEFINWSGTNDYC